MAVMIDANVLINLISEEPDKDDEPELHAQWMAARELVAREQSVHVSSVAWFEAYNVPRDDGTPLGSALDKITKHVVIHPLDIAAVERAAKLLHAKGTQVCPKCYAHAESKVCPGCNREVGKNLRLQDALIVGHADTSAGIDALHTFDDGMVKFAEATGATVTVVEPPAATGAPVIQRYNRISYATAPEAVTQGDTSSSAIPMVLDDDNSTGLPPDDPDDTENPDESPLA